MRVRFPSPAPIFPLWNFAPRSVPASERRLIRLASVGIARGFLRVRAAVFFQVHIRNAVTRLRRIVVMAGELAMQLGRANRRSILKTRAMRIERFVGNRQLERANGALGNMHIKSIFAVKGLDLETHVLHEKIFTHSGLPDCRQRAACLSLSSTMDRY